MSPKGCFFSSISTLIPIQYLDERDPSVLDVESKWNLDPFLVHKELNLVLFGNVSEEIARKGHLERR